MFERGKDVKARRRDLAAINKEHIVNPESNYCFGEGGAGTYSDGKLYTRSSKRGDIEHILKTFVYHGADDVILVDAHPHIGTNKLPNIISNMRETILKHGGEIHFHSKLIDINYSNDEILSPLALPKELLHTIIDEALAYMEPLATRKQRSLIDVIKNLKNRETFTPTKKGKQRQESIDKIRRQDITKILSRDERVLDWWTSI